MQLVQLVIATVPTQAELAGAEIFWLLQRPLEICPKLFHHHSAEW